MAYSSFIRDFDYPIAGVAVIHALVFWRNGIFFVRKVVQLAGITEALSFGKDEGSANRRGAEPSVFSLGRFLVPSFQMRACCVCVMRIGRSCFFCLTNGLIYEKIPPYAGDWRSGSAGPLQGQGRGFKSLIAHHWLLKAAGFPAAFLRIGAFSTHAEDCACRIHRARKRPGFRLVRTGKSATAGEVNRCGVSSFT